MKPVITLELTHDEVRWLANALRISANASKESAPVMSKWTAAFANGLEAKLK